MEAIQSENTNQRRVWLLVLVATLGYFVDIYDLIIFSIVRIQSFKDIGIPEENMRIDGAYVLNMQMGGLLLGGLLWGVIGDRFGRIKVLFGSILLYSLANIANGFVQDIHTYAIIRFIAGIGLAGELGAGVTLVAETMRNDQRGYGTMIIATVGVMGAAAAYFVSEWFAWRNAYFVGGGMGILLLIMRLGIYESGLFKKNSNVEHIRKGSLSMLFTNKARFKRYMYCLLIGLPIWFVVGVFVAQSPEFGKALGAAEVLSAGQGVLFCYLGISAGDLIASLFAQWLKSRKKAIFTFQVLILVSSIWFLSSTGITTVQFKWLAFFMGFSVGYWATFVTNAAEQFGTNLRATVTTSAPNFVRGALIPSTILFELIVPYTGIIKAGYIMIFFLSAIGFWALSKLEETFHKDLDYIEE
jgi:putative MFS transporter